MMLDTGGSLGAITVVPARLGSASIPACRPLRGVHGHRSHLVAADAALSYTIP